ncbi:hypothetical protein RQP46_002564 [Phenoliferia psychrophenolica]
MDSLPVLPTLSGRSLPSFNFNTPSLPSFLCLNPSDSGSSDEDEVPGDKDKDIKDDPLKRLTGNVVVLGGYRGSILRDAKTLKRIWIPLRVGFGLRKPDLAIGLTDEAELRSRETVVPGRMLMAVGGVIDLGKRLKDKLKHLSTLPAPPLDPSDPLARPVSKLNFVNWGYDWRRRLELSSEELLRDLEQMKRESKARGEGPNGEGEGATVIAHSMGGLVTLHALARASDPTVFKGIIFAGTPFGGCVNVLGPLRRGDGVLFNREICSPSVVFSMRSSFYFLPFSGLCFETPSGESLPVNFFDPKSWSDLNLSPVAGYLFDAGKERQRRENREGADRAEDNGVAGVLEPSMGEDSDGREDEVEVPEEAQTEDALIAAYLSKTLERVQIFHSELTSLYDPTRAASYPPMCILTSQKTATVRGVISPSYDSIAANPYDHLLFGAGDGIVLSPSTVVAPLPRHRPPKSDVRLSRARTTMARASFTTLSVELKATIVEMVNDQEDAWWSRVEDGDGRADHINCLSALALVNKECRELAAVHQFKLPALNGLTFSQSAATMLFGPGVTLLDNVDDEEVSYRARMLAPIATKIERLTLAKFRPSETIALVQRFPHVKMLYLRDLDAGGDVEELKPLTNAMAGLRQLTHLILDLPGDATRGWPMEAFEPLERNPPPLQILQLLWFPLDHHTLNLVQLFSRTLEVLTLEIWSPEPEPVLSSRDPLQLPHLVTLNLVSNRTTRIDEPLRLLSSTSTLSTLSFALSEGGWLDPATPAVVGALSSQTALRRLQLGGIHYEYPVIAQPPDEDLASPSSLAAYAHLIHSRNLDASVLDRPHLTPFHPGADLDYTENEGAYLAEVLDRTLDFGRTELKRMVAEGRAASAVEWVEALKPLEDMRLAWKD